MLLHCLETQTLERLSLEESSKERKVAVPQMKDRDAWERFCFAAEIDPLSTQSPAEVLMGESETVGDTVDVISEVMDADVGVAGSQNDVSETVERGTTSSAADRAVSKRKRDLAYQLGITLVKRVDDSAFEVIQQSHISQPADDQAGSDEEREDLDDVENEEVNAAIEGAWAQAAKAMQWSGAVNVEPTTTVLLQFDQVLTQRLLALHIDWMEDRSAACSETESPFLSSFLSQYIGH